MAIHPPKAASSLAGLAPHIRQSGASPGRAQIGGGCPCVRAALYMAALSAVRCDPALRAAYQAMRADGKPAKVALIAIARKLATIANALVKTGSRSTAMAIRDLTQSTTGEIPDARFARSGMTGDEGAAASQLSSCMW